MKSQKIYYAQDTAFEVIQVACEWGIQESAFIFNAFTYLARMGKKTTGKKNIIKDIKKAKYYIEKEIEITELQENRIKIFPSTKLKSMIFEKNPKRQNVKLIMSFWGYGKWFEYHSSDNEKFYTVHKDLISIFKQLNNLKGFIITIRPQYINALKKMLNRIDTMLELMK